MKIRPAKQPGHVIVELSASDAEPLSETVEMNGCATSPFNLKKILVPMDFSDCSKKALQYAVPFAKQFDAHIILLHILPVHYATRMEFDLVNYDPLIEQDMRKYIERRLSIQAQETVPSEIPVEIKVRHGAPSTEIATAAKEMDVDAIVISTHDHTNRARAFIGNVTEDVVQFAPCPVLVVREHEHEFVQSQPGNPFITNRAQPDLAFATTA